MIELPLLLRQPTPSSCLPTAVRAVLLWHLTQTGAHSVFAQNVSQRAVSKWCREGAEGCVWELAISGLMERELDVEEITDLTDVSEADALARLREIVMDDSAPEPVIVTVKDPYASHPMDHALVLVAFSEASVEFLNPATGEMESVEPAEFFEQWDFADRRAPLVRF